MKRHRPKAGSAVSSPVVGGPSSSSPSGPVVRSLVVPSSLVRGLVVLLGFFFGLCLLKFGNPPIMEKFVEAPKGAFELLAMTPWPLRWAYWLLGSLTLLGLIVAFSPPLRASTFRFLSSFVIRLPRRSPTEAGHSSFSIRTFTFFLPLAWLFWQLLSSHFSISRDLSTPTVVHYSACVICFYLGLFCLSPMVLHPTLHAPRSDAPTHSTNFQQSINPTIHQSIPLGPFWLGIFCGFILVVAIGLDQHFGGLQEARSFLYHQKELYPDKQFPPEFLKKMASNRIYSTLFYPNTLAGALLLFTPAMLLTTVRLGDRWRLGNASRLETVLVLIAICLACLFLYLLNTHAGWILIVLLGLSLIFPVPRWIAPAVLSLGILAVLFWSGSKAGWLLMLLLGLIALLRTNFALFSSPSPPRDERAGERRPLTKEDHGDASSKQTNDASASPQHASRNTQHATRIKPLLIIFLLLIGLSGFFLRYSAFFKKGATSVSARFDYWRAALEIAKSHPLLGTGPGTFQIPYEKIKRPESEMARLAHNDYLQQASDSGLPGFLLYTSFIATALLVGRVPGRSPTEAGHSLAAPKSDAGESLHFMIWLGLLGWAAQCLVEFSLQIPALAWPAFALLGYLCAVRLHPQIGLKPTPP